MNIKQTIGLFLICGISLYPTLFYSQNPISIKKEKPSRTSQEKSNAAETQGKKKNSGTQGNKKQSTVTPKTNSQSNPSRTVLYTLGPNEKLYYGEFLSNMNSNGTKFVALTEDKVTHEKHIVVNGNKIFSGGNFYVFDVNLDSDNPVGYGYRTKDGMYIVVDGEKFGPYEDLSFPEPPMVKTFYFKKMGKVFRRDSDGTIYVINDNTLYEPLEIDGKYTSNNGRHQLKFKKENRAIEYKNKEFNLGVSNYATNLRPGDIYITDKGDAYIEMTYNISDKRFRDYYIISNGSMRKCDWESFAPFIEDIDSEFMDDKKRSFWTIYENMRGYTNEEGEWDLGLDITLEDNSGRHNFVANWNYDYVMIDAKEIKCPPPFSAFYDEANNSFTWITQEGKQFVKYTYKL